MPSIRPPSRRLILHLYLATSVRLVYASQGLPPLTSTYLILKDNTVGCFYSKGTAAQLNRESLELRVRHDALLPQTVNIVCPGADGVNAFSSKYSGPGNLLKEYNRGYPRQNSKVLFKFRNTPVPGTGSDLLRKIDKSTYRNPLYNLTLVVAKLNMSPTTTTVRLRDDELKAMGERGLEVTEELNKVCSTARDATEGKFGSFGTLCAEVRRSSEYALQKAQD
ncbi:hypothetical protein FOZ63_008597, partial [Perkinsus olseni]